MEINVNVYNSSSYKRLPNKKVIEAVSNVLKKESEQGGYVNVIYLDDKEIHEMNNKYLQHDYPTDVISFSLGEGTEIEGEIYIGVDTARQQAKHYRVSFSNELLRLAVHGALHLVGYDDADSEERERMHQLENKYLK